MSDHLCPVCKEHRPRLYLGQVSVGPGHGGAHTELWACGSCGVVRGALG